MLSRFLNRNLSKTVNFLLRNKIQFPGASVGECKDELRIDQPEYLKGGTADHNTGNNSTLLAITYQNLSEFYLAYSSLLCKHSRDNINRLVFCKCCNSIDNFVRNNNLVNSGQFNGEVSIRVDIDSTDAGNTDHLDPFLLFLYARVSTRKTAYKLLLSVIEKEPYFYEAIELLSTVTPSDGGGLDVVALVSPLHIYYYALLVVNEQFEPKNITVGIRSHALKNNKMDMCNMDGVIDHILDQNLVAAYLYEVGEYEKSEKIFSQEFENNHHNLGTIENGLDFRYFERYSLILYRKGENEKLCRLVKEMEKKQVGSSHNTDISNVFYISKGIYEASTSNYRSAIDLFGLVVKSYSNKPLIFTMIGKMHELLLEKEKAIEYLIKSDEKIIEDGDDEIIAKLSRSGEECGNKTDVTPKPYFCKNHFHALFNIAHSYYNLNILNHALYYAQIALVHRSDANLHKLIGRIYYKHNKLNEAVFNLKESVRLGEIDSLLYIAEIYKNNSMGDEGFAGICNIPGTNDNVLNTHSNIVIQCYEEYIKKSNQKQNKLNVIKYLVEYFEEEGMIEEAMTYRRKMEQDNVSDWK